MFNNKTANKMRSKKTYGLKTTLLIFVLLSFNVYSQNNHRNTSTAKDTIVAGFSTHIFTQTNFEDAKAALSLLLNEIISNYWNRPNIYTIPVTYDNIDNIKKDIDANKLDLVALTSSEYLILRDKVKITPCLTYKTGSITQDKLLLLVREDSGIKSIQDLKRKKVAIFSFVSDEFSTPTIWYKTLVLSNDGNYKKDYGPFLESQYKSARAIMDVFFKKAQGVVVSEKEFHIANELNPQIGKQLKIIASSKPILYSAICYTEKLKQHNTVYIEELVDSFCTVHKKSIGRNFLQIFKITQFIPYKDGYMNNTEDLYNEFIEVSNKKKKYLE